MKKITLLSLPILFIGCSALIDVEANEDDKKRAEMRKRSSVQNSISQMRRKMQIDDFENIPFPHKIIESPDLSNKEIYQNSYLWLEMKFSNYKTNNFVETRMDEKIRIEYKGDFALEIPNKIKISKLIIVIDIKSKKIKIGMMKPPTKSSEQTLVATPMSAYATSFNRENELNQQYEQEFELIQDFDDFIFKKID